MTALDDFFSIIPAGGVGSRLWPLSRADAPKFLHDLTGSGKTLLRATFDRLVPLTGPGRTMVVTGRAHRAAVEAQIPELDDASIVLEADPRDSTVAVALAAAILRRREPDVIVGSFAADHVIHDERSFRRTVVEAVAAARTGRIATIGITPTEPAIGFGYIRANGSAGIDGAPSAAIVREFVEKPSLDRARRYVADGDYLWNAGMFIARADVLLEELARTEPQLAEQIEQLAAVWDEPARRGPAVDRVWPELKKIAIDYSVAEPAAARGNMVVIPGDFDWDDVGDFSAVAKLHNGGRRGRLAILGSEGTVLADSASGIVVSQSKRIVSVVGIQDVVVVDTPDALLVTTTDNAQRVKQVVDAVRRSGNTDAL
ncbi:mannose-1-phosphate guanylyltransferase [Agrococcus sp. HG114]|uniref:mannose-1-phosphate guanylyltransferase n=1 Tax=Agrococcus sp. HG114 TaxID=2969757 RepID=UPI00215B5AE9|nr:mannose-1-phosphate guanylyltransferase [Agrococcus sp. HG114]MCR8670553.1 mannose-1-phosphate guanylyltransferase [Agrococcus sp. HG114]